MKKAACLFLAVIMLTGLCGCLAENGTDDVRGNVVSGNNSQNAQEPELSLGKTENNTYNNEFLGLSCTLPSDWVFYTDEQILELNNIIGDVLGEEIAQQLKNANVIYDMVASSQTEGSSLNVTLEKLSAVQMINLDIKQALEAQFDTMKSSYQNMGYTDIRMEYEKIEVDGKEFDGLKLVAKIQGYDFYVTAFAFRKSNYLANVTVCSFEKSRVEAILDYFTVK